MMDSFSNFDLLAACFRRIDISDLSPTHFYSYISFPYLFIHRDVLFQRFRLPNECFVLNSCMPGLSHSDLVSHYFCFQNPLCSHICLRFLDNPFETFIFGETEQLRSNPNLRLGCLYLLTRAKEFFFQHSSSLVDPTKLCYASVKIYSWEHRRECIVKITCRIRCLKKGGASLPDTEFGTTVSWTITHPMGFDIFRRDGADVLWRHLLFQIGPHL